IDAEDELALRRGESAKVCQVRVTAKLRVNPRLWGRGQVRGHDDRGASIEGEGRREHTPVPDGDKVSHPGSPLLLQQSDRIGPICRRRPGGMALAGRFSASGSPNGDTL